MENTECLKRKETDRKGKMTNEIEKGEKGMKTKQPTFLRSNATDAFVYETPNFLLFSLFFSLSKK